MSVALVLLLSLSASAQFNALTANDSCGSQCLTDEQFDQLMDQTKTQADAKAPILIQILPFKPSDIIQKTHDLYHGGGEELRGKKILPFGMKEFGGWQGDVYSGVDTYEKKAEVDRMPDGPAKVQQRKKAQEALDKFREKVENDKKNAGPIAGLFAAGQQAWQQLLHPKQPSNGGGGVQYNPSWGDTLNPASSDVNQAYQKMQEGDAAGAKELADRALRFDANNRDALDARGQASFDLKDYRGASRDAQRALDLDSGDKTAQAIYGLAHDRWGVGASEAAGQAQAQADQAGAASAGGAGSGASPLIGASRGAPAPSATDIAAQLSLRDYQAALAAAGRAIQAHPDDPRAYFYSAVARMKLGDHEGALKDAVAGLGVDPKSTALLDAKAEALNRLGRYRDALAAASAALEINPKDPYAYYNRGLALFGMKDREASVEALRQAAALDPMFQATADRAASAPSDADLSFLLPDTGGAAARPAAPAQKAGRFGVVAVSSVLGGLLIALGLLQFFIEPVKSAFTRLTRKGAPASDARLSLSPLARDGSPGLLRGQYQVLGRIGQGGMGVVYEGRDVSLERKVAVKRMREELKRDPRERQRFLSEAKLVAALHHPHIVDIYAIVEEGEEVYLVFEHINGRTVHEIIHANGKLGFDYALNILRGVASALDFAHGRGIIHRDLKPSNVMIDDEGRPRVMDFGIARAAKDALTRQSALMTNTVVGTPPYMAPEQEQGVVRREADVYALAVCFYEMLTGKLPFAGTGAGMLLNKVNNSFAPASSLAPDLPQGLDSVMAMALDPDPAKRFSSAKQLVDALDGLRAGARRAV